MAKVIPLRRLNGAGKHEDIYDLMADCPSPVAPKQLRDLRIRLVEDEPKA